MRCLSLASCVLLAVLLLASPLVVAQSNSRSQDKSIEQMLEQQRFEIEALKRELLHQAELIDILTAQIEQQDQEQRDENVSPDVPNRFLVQFSCNLLAGTPVRQAPGYAARPRSDLDARLLRVMNRSTGPRINK